MDSFLRAGKNINKYGLKKKEEVLRKFKNERSVMLTAVWDCCGLVYTEFDLMPIKRSELSPKTLILIM